MDDQFFVRCCTLEGQLELANKRAWEMEQLVREARTIIFDAGLTADNTDWYTKASRALGDKDGNL